MGSLIQLEGTSLPSPFYFIRQAMKKPQSQVLIQGFLLEERGDESAEVSIIHPELQRPAFLTSHQLFVNVCDGTERSIESIPFMIHEYDVNPFKPLLQVSLTSVTGGHAFSSRASTQVKRPPRVAFGFKKSPRKRRARVKEKPVRNVAALRDMPALPESCTKHGVQKLVEQFAGVKGLTV